MTDMGSISAMMSDLLHSLIEPTSCHPGAAGAHPELVQLSLMAALVVRGSLRAHLTMRALETPVPPQTSS